MNCRTVSRAPTGFSAITTPLPAASPSALITIGYLERSRIAYASAVVEHSEKSAVGMPFFFEELLRKDFAGFEARLIGSGTDNSEAALAENVNDTFAQRHFRADKRQIDPFCRRKVGDALDIVRFK